MNHPLRILLASILAGAAAIAQAQTYADDGVDDRLGGFASIGESLIKQSAYFESSQVVQRFFRCIAEASNYKEQPGVLESVKLCFDEIVDENININIAGQRSRGREAALAIATQGLASLRNNTSFSLTVPYISQYQRGRAPGTGAIQLHFYALVHQNITNNSNEPLPFQPILGPQLFVANDTLGLRAVVPGKWKITLLKVDPLFTEPSPDILFREPYPHYPIAAPR